MFVWGFFSPHSFKFMKTSVAMGNVLGLFSKSIYREAGCSEPSNVSENLDQESHIRNTFGNGLVALL